MVNKIRIGTRSSVLAIVQTEYVAKQLKAVLPHLEIEIVKMSTKGDERLNQSLSSFGGKGVFTKELEDALHSKTIDMAVHSAKDMPMELPQGLGVGAVFERADVRDVLVTLDGQKLKTLKPETVVGTGSLRRELQLRAANPGIVTKQIRGNVQTRLQKLAERQYDAIVLAAAGLHRLGYTQGAVINGQQFYFEYLDTDVMLPAACQGILAVETRIDDSEMMQLLAKVNDNAVMAVFEAERSYLSAINGGCNAPTAALAEYDANGDLHMRAMYAPEMQEIFGVFADNAEDIAKHLKTIKQKKENQKTEHANIAGECGSSSENEKNVTEIMFNGYPRCIYRAEYTEKAENAEQLGKICAQMVRKNQ